MKKYQLVLSGFVLLESGHAALFTSSSFISNVPSPTFLHDNRRIICSPSLYASSSSSSDNDSEKSTSSSSSNSGEPSSSKSLSNNNSYDEGPWSNIRYIDAYTQQQISNIFSISDSSFERTSASNNNQQQPGDALFVPLSLAGRWSQKYIQKSKESSKNNNQASSSSTTTIETIFLSSPEQCQSIAHEYKQYLLQQDNNQQLSSTTIEALPIPISKNNDGVLKLLSQTYTTQPPLSKSVLLTYNSIFLNRDNGLFDNLPWSTWSIDPKLKERDAAHNTIESKYTMGKRVAYQRFMGKDWKGRSLSLNNLVLKVRYLLEQQQQEQHEDGDETKRSDESMRRSDANVNDDDENGMLYSLSQRLLQLEIKEGRMKIAECEQQLAIAKAQSANTDTCRDDDSDTDAAKNDNDDTNTREAMMQLEKARERLQLAESSLDEIMNKAGIQSEEEEEDVVTSILDKLFATGKQENPPPYRGAIGYPAQLDSKEEMLEGSILPYTSPYDLLLEIINEQLNSNVIGCVLEPTSLIQGNLVLGGAILLQRKGVTKSTTLSGEVVTYTDDDDDLGNEGVLPRAMYVVECYSDEAIGMAMATKMPIFVQEDVHNRACKVQAKVDVEEAATVKMDNSGVGDDDNQAVANMESLSYINRVPLIRPLDESYCMSSRFEGEAITSSEESNMVRIPLTSNPDVFDGSSIQQRPPSSSSGGSRSVFSTFNPVKSIDEYDELTDDDKARLLLKLESFTGLLPRPRTVRMSTLTATKSGDYATDDDGSPPSILDEILLPLIDESVRRQYQIRDAERRKDFMEADALRRDVSARQVALERAQQARDERGLPNGSSSDANIDDEAIRLAEEEAELYKALRADITQDEGAYDRYLDRDEWYECETQARIKRMDKSKFGTLLDGID